MKTFLKVMGSLLAVAVVLKGILMLIDYFYETYAVRYIESEIPVEN